MRIGKFAKVNNLSIDTIRYYVSLNLIHPIRKGKYFYFEKNQQAELDRLLYLKALRFTLEEAKKIVTAQELSKIKTSKESDIFEKLLMRKRDDLTKEIAESSLILKKIQDEIESIKEKSNSTNNERGIKFDYLSLINCPNCGKQIEISEGILKGNGVYEGKSICSCGYSLNINQGIIVVNHKIENIIEPYEEANNYIDDFVIETPKTFLDTMMNASKEIISLLFSERLEGKVVLFMKSGLGYLENMLLEQVKDMKLVILVDEDFDKLKVAKKSIESNFSDFSNVVYICSELYELPIRKKAVDICVDFLATFMNGFRSGYNMYEYINPLLREKSCIMGFYLYFKSIRMLSRLPEVQRRLFDNRTIPQSIKKYGFIERSNYEENILTEGTNINGFFQEGDKVYCRIKVFERNQNI